MGCGVRDFVRAFFADYLVLPDTIIVIVPRSFPAIVCRGRSRNASRRRPAPSPLTSSARCGTAVMSRTMSSERPQPRVLVDGSARSERLGSIFPIFRRTRRRSRVDRRRPACLPELLRRSLRAQLGDRSTCPIIAVKASCMSAGQSCTAHRP